MDIGLITDSIDMGAPGVSRYIRNLISELLKQNEINGARHKFFLIHEKENEDEIYKQNNINEIIIKSYNIPLGRELRKLVFLKNALVRYNLDIVHDLAQVGPFMFNNSFKKFETIYDLTPIKFPQFHPMASYYRTKIGIPLIKNKVDQFITISENTKQDLIELYDIKPEKIKTIYLAADNIFKKGYNKDRSELNELGINDKFLLFVGTIEPRKNVKGLLSAFSIIKEQIENIQLVIVGKEGWKSHDVISILSKKNNDIIWLKALSDDKLCMLYNNASLMMFPTFYEGFGLPVLEAMTCGCPVVVSNIPVMHEVVGGAGLLFEPSDNTSIAKKTINILKDDSLRKDLIQKGLNQSKKFSWDKCARETLILYNNI